MKAWSFRIGLLAVALMVWLSTGSHDAFNVIFFACMIAFIDYRLIRLEDNASRDAEVKGKTTM